MPEMIPTFIVEEHHEAFFVWNYAVLSGMVPERLNTLLHVDNHADLQLPRLETSLKELGQDPAGIFAFTKNQLGIADFILPAVYRGLFTEIYWLVERPQLLDKERFLNVVSLNGDGHTLIVTDNFLLAGMFNPDRQAAVLRQIDCTGELSPAGKVILDIDLDYFSCDAIGGETWQVQVTEGEYRRALDDPYHRLRLKFGGKLQVQARDGKYYLGYHPPLIQDGTPSDRTRIVERMDSFIRWLQTNHLQPALIDICRSRFSGYTPIEHWQWIEAELLGKMAKIFPMMVKHLDELTETMALSA